MDRNQRRFSVVLALGLAAPAAFAPLGAQERDHPLEARGLAGGGPVSVSPMSGALGVVIPIGQSYSVSPLLSYGLNLVYNGNT